MTSSTSSAGSRRWAKAAGRPGARSMEASAGPIEDYFASSARRARAAALQLLLQPARPPQAPAGPDVSDGKEACSSLSASRSRARPGRSDRLPLRRRRRPGRRHRRPHRAEAGGDLAAALAASVAGRGDQHRLGCVRARRPAAVRRSGGGAGLAVAASRNAGGTAPALPRRERPGVRSRIGAGDMSWARSIRPRLPPVLISYARGGSISSPARPDGRAVRPCSRCSARRHAATSPSRSPASSDREHLNGHVIVDGGIAGVTSVAVAASPGFRRPARTRRPAGTSTSVAEFNLAHAPSG